MILRVGTSVIDCDRREIKRAGVDAPVPRKTFDLLQVLLDERPKVVRKDELISRVWPETFVADANLAVLIADLRAALGDSALRPRIIKTHHRVGYSFMAEVTELSGPPLGLPMIVLVAGKRRISLRDGTFTVGRDERCDIVLPHSSVSRVHARLTIAGESVVVEDNGSKNGTHVDDARLRQPLSLQSGQSVTFGTIVTSIVIGPGSPGSTITAEDPE